MGGNVLSFATNSALAVLAGETLKPIGMVTALARLVREIAPEEFDAWVDRLFSGGFHLGLVAAVRSPLDFNREQAIEDHLAKGELAAGAYLPVLNHLRTFVGILRVKLEAELGVKTSADQVELDLALESYMNARRIKLMAESLIGPIAKEADAIRGIKLLEEARGHDREFRRMIENLRMRARRHTRTIEVDTQTGVAIRVTTATAVQDHRHEAMSA